MSKVSVVRAEKDLKSSVAKALEDLPDKIVASGDRVLIKPNLVEPSSPESGQITTPKVVEAVARYCLESGARGVIIGEGPGYYQPASNLKECFIRPGIADIAKKLGIKWVSFDDYKFQTFKAIPGIIARDFHITEYAFNCDKIINLPVLKAHYLTRVTLGMKNLKGCLKWEDKALFHRIDVEKAVVELNKIVRPSVTIIDGTPSSIARQLGTGISHWKDGNGGVIIAGKDIVAVDTVGSALMGIDPYSVNTIKFGNTAGLGESDLARIDVAGEELKRFEFIPGLPEKELRLNFPSIKILGARKACCGCVIPLLSCLNSLKDKGLKSDIAARIFIGEKSAESSGDNSLTIGDCAYTGNASRSVKGCPPAPDEIFVAVYRLLQGR